jgi:hypothetical protein
VALRRVKYESDGQLFRIEGGAELSLARDGALVMPRDAVSDVGVAYLAKALCSAPARAWTISSRWPISCSGGWTTATTSRGTRACGITG